MQLIDGKATAAAIKEQIAQGGAQIGSRRWQAATPGSRARRARRGQ